MKNLKSSMTSYVCLLLFVITFSISAQDQKKQYAPVVDSLKSMYENSTDFKKLMDNTLSSAVSPLDGWSSDPVNSEKLYIWTEKSFTDFLDFFQNWLTFVPNPENGMKFYELLYGLCYKNSSAIKFVSTEPGLSWTKQFVEARGVYMNSKISVDNHVNTMKMWKESMGKEWENYLPPHPETEGFYGYTTFNEFFTRDIKKEVRPVSAPSDQNTLTAPADGIVNIINENLNTNSRIHTKYDEYLNIGQLLGGSEYADVFVGGTAVSTVLMPENYHHYHSPAKGVVVESKRVDSEKGVYFGMDGQFFSYKNNGNVGGYKSNYGVFGVYHRGYYIIRTQKFGYIAMIAVGLDDISSINFENQYKPETIAKKPAVVSKGQKVGHFAYGGSTVILLFEPGVLSGIKLKQGAQLSTMSAIRNNIK